MTDPEPTTEDICMSCGLCCDGTLFGRVYLFEDEEPAPAVAEMLEPDAQYFRQKCAGFAGCCQIYEDRPRTCRVYRCGLLIKVEQGEITTDAAQSLIERTKAGCEQMERMLPTTKPAIRVVAKMHLDELKRELDAGNAQPMAMMEMMQMSSFLASLWSFDLPDRDQSEDVDPSMPVDVQA